MIDRWKEQLIVIKFGAVLTDVPKAFDCICHDLLVSKLHAYGLPLPALKMIQDYLLNRKQRKLDPHTVHGRILYLVFRRDRS